VKRDGDEDGGRRRRHKEEEKEEEKEKEEEEEEGGQVDIEGDLDNTFGSVNLCEIKINVRDESRGTESLQEGWHLGTRGNEKG